MSRRRRSRPGTAAREAPPPPPKIERRSGEHRANIEAADESFRAPAGSRPSGVRGGIAYRGVRLAASPMTARSDRLRAALRITVTLLAAFFLQTVALLLVGGADFAPDLILASVAAISLAHGPAAAIASGAVAGLLQDSFSSGLLGMRGFSKPLIGYGVARVGERLLAPSTGQTAVILLAAAIADRIVLRLLAAVTGAAETEGLRLGAVAAGLPLTVGYGLLLFRVLRKRAPDLPLTGSGAFSGMGGGPLPAPRFPRRGSSGP